eukprot:3549386-Amphidinium_carterae.2
MAKRLARYLLQRPRVATLYKWQDTPTTITMQGDSDYAGDPVKRVSTSGWCALHGTHLIAGGTSTQSVIATSSGEAEHYACLKAAAEGLGLVAMAAELGNKRELRVETDSSASYGICRRRGSGRMKHLE